ncbi:DUF4279 domain-containing protein [Sphingomonas sp. Leaf4]|uniref:DUF4279 domain-containing protein n=1 Tax=Sphingomonas sp. Leaf4 TaxID=2876553 RepID=UPI001E5A1904|nr:DUF4279 domain-containing protein [Sphingomonas sp. Leaf4]
MGQLHTSAVSLGFFGDDLDPVEITQALGATPTVGVRKGDPWHTATGAEKIATRGQWRLVSERRQPGDPDGQINDLLDRLSDDLPRWRSLAGRYRGRIFCGLFLASGNEGVTFQPETLTRTGERGLLLDLDIYSADDPH